VGKTEWINKYDQMLDLTATKTPYQKEVFSQVLQDVIKRVDKSFKNFLMVLDILGFRVGTGITVLPILKWVFQSKMESSIFQK